MARVWHSLGTWTSCCTDSLYSGAWIPCINPSIVLAECHCFRRKILTTTSLSIPSLPSCLSFIILDSATLSRVVEDRWIPMLPWMCGLQAWLEWDTVLYIEQSWVSHQGEMIQELESPLLRYLVSCMNVSVIGILWLCCMCCAQDWCNIPSQILLNWVTSAFKG